MLAIRDVGESERSEYGIVQLRGDSIVFDRVIAPYFVAQRQAEDLPLSSVIITPRNYKFRYAGAVKSRDSAAYIFRITPKKNRAGLIRGELWIEPVTGAPVLVTRLPIQNKALFSMSLFADFGKRVEIYGRDWLLKALSATKSTAVFFGATTTLRLKSRDIAVQNISR